MKRILFLLVMLASIQVIGQENKKVSIEIEGDTGIVIEKGVKKIYDLTDADVLKEFNKTINDFNEVSKENIGTFSMVKNIPVYKFSSNGNDYMRKTEDIVTDTLCTADSVINKGHQLIRNGLVWYNDKVVKDLLIKDSMLYHKGRVVGDTVIMFEKKKELELDVDEVLVNIYDGVINSVAINSGGEKHFFRRKMISLPRYNKTSKNYYMRNVWNTEEDEYVLLLDVLRFESESSAKYVPDSAIVKLTPKDTSQKMTISNNLKTLVDFRVYSDFFGLIDEAANGLISFEGNAKIYVNPNPYGMVFFANSINPYVYVSKFDSGEKFVKTVMKDSLAKVYNYMDMLQKSYVTAGLNLDIFTLKFKAQPVTLTVPLIGQYNIARLDSLSGAKNIQSTTYGSGVVFDFRKTNNFGLSAGILMLNNHHLYNEKNGIAKIPDFWTMNIKSEMFFYPGQAKAGAIFLRLNYVSSFEKDESNNYFQLQFGYKADLNFSKK